MTDDELAEIKDWLDHATAPCGNDMCVGEWADAHGKALVAEIKRLRALLRHHGIDPDEEVKACEPEPYWPPRAWAVDENEPKGTVRFRAIW